MRIISGIYGGRRFDAPKNLPARPTTDLAKGALFNILQNRIDFEGTHCLDLFGGTGSISFEMLSRGASQVCCVEMGRIQQQFIQKTASELHIGQELQLVRGDVFKYIKSHATTSTEGSGRFDFIFADPPYALTELAELPQLVLGAHLLKPEGILVIEHGDDNDFSQHPNFREIRIYGAVHFSFFEP